MRYQHHPGSRNAMASLACAAAACASVACGGAEPSASELPVSTRLLHVAYVEDQKIEFTSLGADGESPSSPLVTSTLRRGGREVVGELFRHYGFLTALEVFNAVAPSDEAPPELVASHPFEALAFQRESREVRAVTLDWLRAPAASSQALRAEPIEKSLPPGATEECSDIVFGFDDTAIWSQTRLVTHSSPDEVFSRPGFLCVGGSSNIFEPPGSNICSQHFITAFATRVGICHFDPDSDATAIQIGGSRVGEDMGYDPPQAIEFNDIRVATFFPRTSPRRSAIVNFPPLTPYAYILASSVGSEP